MVRICWGYLAFFLFSCSCTPSSTSGKSDFFSLELVSVNGEKINLEEIKGNKASAFFFLSPDCPLSQKYSLSIKNIFSEFSQEKINFYLVFPGKLYDPEEIKKFLLDYDLSFVSISDSDKKLTDNLKATVTPEVFLIDSKASVLYRGAIDNWFVAVGQQRQVITGHYLADALESFLSGDPITISETEAVGCIIE